ncbi:MAG: FG-GAP-like repeat-containing protein [Sedimentisphaeraceae bacterium JB056]
MFRRALCWMCLVLSYVLAGSGSVFSVDSSGHLDWYKNDKIDSLDLVSEYADAVAAGNLDGDAYLDIIVGRNYSNKGCLWFEQNSDGSTYSIVNSSFGSNTVSNGIAIGDLDSDGNVDLMVVRSGTCNWYESRSDNTVSWVSNITTQSVSPVLCSFDGDAYTDMFLVKATTVSWYEGNGNDNSVNWRANFGPSGAVKVCAGYVDDDNSADVLIIKSDGTIDWYEANGNNTTPTFIKNFGTGISTAAILDVDGDGQNEVVCGDISGAVMWYRSSTDNSVSVSYGPELAANCSDIASACNTSDDIISIVNSSGEAVLYSNLDVNNDLGYVKELLTLDGVTAMAVGDLDNDDYTDVCIGRSAADAAWFEIDGDSLYFSSDDFSGTAIKNGIDIVDMHDDGYGDILTIISGGTVKWYEASGDNTVTLQSGGLTGSGVALDSGNLDGDGYCDLFIVKTTMTGWYEANSSQHVINWRKNITSTAFNGAKDIAIGDIDGDSYGDLLLVDSSSNVQWYESDGVDNATPSLVTTFYSGGDATSVAISDVDEDGINEVVISVDDDNVIWYESNSDNTISNVAGTTIGSDFIDLAMGITYEGNPESLEVLSESTVYSTTNGDDLMFPVLHIDSKDPNHMYAAFDAGSHPDNQYHVTIESGNNGDDWAVAMPSIGCSTIIDLSGNPCSVSLPFYTEVNASNSRIVDTVVTWIYDYSASPQLNPDMYLGFDSELMLYEPHGNDMSGKYMGDISINDASCFASADFDDDGTNTLIVGKDNGYVAWYESDDDNSIAAVTGGQFGYDLLDIACAVGYSGENWVFTVNSSYELDWYEVDSQGSNQVTYIDTLDISGMDCVAVAAGDFDGDSYPDILVGNSVDYSSRWYEYDSQTDTFVNVLGFHTSAIAVNGLEIGDFDYDGNTDLIILSSNGQLHWRECTGNNTMAWRQIITSDVLCFDIEVFDCDVYPDLFIAKTGYLHWYEGNGTDGSYNWKGSMEIDSGINAVSIESIDNDEFVEKRFNAQITSFSQDVSAFSFWRSIVQLSNGNLLATMYGMFDSDSYSRTIVVESDDLGQSWEYKSTVAYRSDSWMGTGGASEPVMVKLSNGNLLCVMRTGMIPFDLEGDCPMIYCISSDNGATWSSPNSLHTPGVGPDMTVLNDGSVLLSYGRPGVHLRIADATGNNWGTPFDIYEGSGCGYSGIRQAPDGAIYMIYGESDFSAWWSLDGDTNYMKFLSIDYE